MARYGFFSYFNALIDVFEIDWISMVGYLFGVSWNDKIRNKNNKNLAKFWVFMVKKVWKYKNENQVKFWVFMVKKV